MIYVISNVLFFIHQFLLSLYYNIIINNQVFVCLGYTFLIIISVMIINEKHSNKIITTLSLLIFHKLYFYYFKSW